jgi:ABC-type bacteriocin/lantibiotic exporter with double-glycine peptidase domain
LVPQTAELGEGLPQGLPERVELAEVPFFPQLEYECGPAALATALTHFNVKVTPDDLVGEVYLPERKGSLQIEMLAAARRHGMVSYQLAPRLKDLLRELAGGVPVIVLQDQGLGPFERWHYAVARFSDFNLSVQYRNSEVWTSVRDSENTLYNDPQTDVEKMARGLFVTMRIVGSIVNVLLGTINILKQHSSHMSMKRKN